MAAILHNVRQQSKSFNFHWSSIVGRTLLLRTSTRDRERTAGPDVTDVRVMMSAPQRNIVNGCRLQAIGTSSSGE